MWILPLVGYIGLAIGFGFLTLAIGIPPFPQRTRASQLINPCIASGLYYLSELVEEHTVIAKKLLTRLIYFVIAVHSFLFVVDGFPLKLAAVSIVSHVVYLGNMRRFPVVKLTDPLFLASCGMSLSNHSALERVGTKNEQR